MSTDELLAAALTDDDALTDAAKRIFAYAGFLLDDDEKLTKTGVLNGVAREMLRKRIVELVGGPAMLDE